MASLLLLGMMAYESRLAEIENKKKNSTENMAKSKKTETKASTESSTRVLRPRKPVTSQEEAKTKPVPKVKKVKNSKAQGKDSSQKNKRTKNAKESEEDEPDTKRSKSDDPEDTEAGDEENIYAFTAKDIAGEEVSLQKYKGHPCIIVNVASKCGHTASNYKELVEVFDKYSEDKGLRILAFPCNQFGKQEPADNDKICEFAKKRNVQFDMFKKIEVNGKTAHPLWKYLKSQKEGPKGREIEWNFTKFLINKDGEVVDRFKPTVKPLALVKDLEEIW